MDGIDVALLRTDGESICEPGPSSFFEYGAKKRKLLQCALDDAVGVSDRDSRIGCLNEAETLVTNAHVECVQQFLSDHKLSTSDIDVIGFHGQTVLHRPEEALTVQIGDGVALAQQAGIDVVYDMRANDMVHGGQGAPLIPVYHQALAKGASFDQERHDPIAFVNIGGISNITYVGDELLAFDCGPGNALIDQWVMQQIGISYDQGGMIAAEGQIDEKLVAEYLAHPFFDRDLPKSLDRNDFSLPEASYGNVETVARSLARVTAESIMASTNVLPSPPKVWIICGGGRKNPHIMADLAELAVNHEARVSLAEDFGLNGDMLEAEAWGFLAVRSIKGLPLTFPGTTGVSHPIAGGKFAPHQ